MARLRRQGVRDHLHPQGLRPPDPRRGRGDRELSTLLELKDSIADARRIGRSRGSMFCLGSVTKVLPHSNSSTISGCRSSTRINWLVGPLGSTRPRSYLSNAFSPTLSNSPALRCESFSFLRMRRM